MDESHRPGDAGGRPDGALTLSMRSRGSMRRTGFGIR
jgi:hypothetical protein